MPQGDLPQQPGARRAGAFPDGAGQPRADRRGAPLVARAVDAEQARQASHPEQLLEALKAPRQASSHWRYRAQFPTLTASNQDA